MSRNDSDHDAQADAQIDELFALEDQTVTRSDDHAGTRPGNSGSAWYSYQSLIEARDKHTDTAVDLWSSPLDQSGQIYVLPMDAQHSRVPIRYAVGAPSRGKGRWPRGRGRKGSVKRAKILDYGPAADFEDFIRFNCNCVESSMVVFQLAYRAGLRTGEIAALELDTLRDAQGNLLPYVTVFAGRSKSGRPRIIPMHPKLREALVALIERFPYAKRVAFSCQWGQDIKYQNATALARYVHHLFRRAGFQGCSGHTGRRSFATNLMREGVYIRDVQALLGHKSLATTEAYLEPPAAMTEAVLKLK